MKWRVGETFLGLLYPRVCAGCGEGLREERPSSMCAKCESELTRIFPPRCEVCGEPFDAAVSGPFRCSNCTGREIHFAFAAAAYRAEGRARELIHRFKYLREHHLSHSLGWMLEHGACDERLATGEWLMVPVPLHPRRRREREYNQAAELCRNLRRRCGWRMVEALRRTRYTAMQANLDRGQRLKNLEGAFAVRRGKRVRSEIEGARIVVVDDVLTTGATASECARVLKEEGGAGEVAVLTVARG